MKIIMALFNSFVFPGLFFLVAYALFAEWMDRKLYAKMQNRVGPPLLQPLADIVKLLAKETIVPSNADAKLFHLMPYFAFAGVATSFLFIPVLNTDTIFSYPGDLVIVVYLLAIPTITLALAGWTSRTAYSIIGGIRCLSQLFSYEIPFFVALLTPSLLVGTWNISEISNLLPVFLVAHPFYFIPTAIAFIVGIISLQGKLERKPFDIPDAETEIVAGPLTEYSGRLYGIFRLTMDMEMVAGASLLAAVFLGGTSSFLGLYGFVSYILKTFIIIFILAFIKTATARIRIDQMVSFGWKVLAPLSLVAMFLAVIFYKGGLI
jgi:NADH-quinone oxidoreductase subunit H